MEYYYKFMMKLPSAFSTIEYALYIINFIVYHVSDTTAINCFRDHIDSFMMMAGVVLFFTARDHFSYYTSKIIDRVAKAFERPQ